MTSALLPKKNNKQTTHAELAAPTSLGAVEEHQGAMPGMPLFLDPSRAWGRSAASPPAPPGLPLQCLALSIGPANDPLEEEADAVARRIVSGAQAGAISLLTASAHESTQTSNLQQARGAQTAPADNTDQVAAALGETGQGNPLQPKLRAEMEQGFARDFSSVRVHSDSRSAGAAAILQARAFALGSDIYLAATESAENRQLMAHELTHVVQQTGTDPHAPQPCRQNSTCAYIQRWPLFGLDPDLTVAEVLRRQDPDLVDNLEPARRTGASGSQKLELIRLLTGQGWVGPEDEGLLVELWGSFGDLPSVAGSNLDLWCISVAAGADLASLQVVRDWRLAFENDVKNTAIHHLAANRDYVLQEMERMGISADVANQPMDANQQAAVEEIQAIAIDVQHALHARQDLQRLVVGYDLVPESRPGLIGLATMGDQSPQEYAEEVVGRRGRRALDIATFDPFRPPHHAPFGDESPAMASYQQVKDSDENLKRYISGYANRYPSIYALIREDRVEETASPETSPEQARQAISQVLLGTLTKIDETVPKIDGDLDWRDLVPIHEQLKGGAAAASHPWREGFGGWVVDDLMGEYQAREFWLQLGLASLAAAAFVVVELATVGSATFFIAAGLAIGIPAAQATFAWENYEDLATAAGTGATEETELVTQGQASAEMFRAAIDTAVALLAAFGVAGRMAAGARGTASAGAAGERALFASARGQVNSRIAFLRQKMATVLSRRYPRSQVVEMCSRQLQEIRETAVSNAVAIREGRMAGMGSLSAAQRNELADRLVTEVGEAWRQAQSTVNAAAESAAVEVVPLEGGGYGASRLGSPPVRRPPSGHHGGGWESGW